MNRPQTLMNLHVRRLWSGGVCDRSWKTGPGGPDVFGRTARTACAAIRSLKGWRNRRPTRSDICRSTPMALGSAPPDTETTGFISGIWQHRLCLKPGITIEIPIGLIESRKASSRFSRHSTGSARSALDIDGNCRIGFGRSLNAQSARQRPLCVMLEDLYVKAYASRTMFARGMAGVVPQAR